MIRVNYAKDINMFSNLRQLIKRALPKSAQMPDSATLERQKALEEQKAAILKQWNFKFSNNVASINIPKGSSVMDLIRSAQDLCINLYNKEAVHSCFLQSDYLRSDLESIANKDVAVSMLVNAPNSANKTLDDLNYWLKNESFELAQIQHLAAAHILYFLSTGKDLFNGNLVRVSLKGRNPVILASSSEGLYRNTSRSGLLRHPDLVAALQI